MFDFEKIYPLEDLLHDKAVLLCAVMENKAWHGFDIRIPAEEEKKNFKFIYDQEDTGFTVCELKIMLSLVRQYLQTFIISGLLARPEKPTSGKFRVLDPMESAKALGVSYSRIPEESDEEILVTSQDLRIRGKENTQWHNRGLVWVENNRLHVGFY